MVVKILGEGETVPVKNSVSQPEVKVDQFEVFGRLNMTRRQIAQYYGITFNQVDYLFRNGEIKKAYDRGRAETTIAIRQKQLQVAFGQTDGKGNQIVAPNPQMLIFCGQQFGEQEKDTPDFSNEDHAPNRFSWDTQMRKQVEAVRAKLGTGTGE